jgi:farnesyl-diphosphate farnesyltransferase
MRAAGDLGKAVLRDVSRSFYLSLRTLPSGFREPASLGYLLARLSDTIADAGAIGRPERVALLDRFGEVIREGVGSADRNGLCEALGGLAGLDDWSEGERALLARAADVLAWFDLQEEGEQHLLQEVVGIIVSGQRWDLERFAGDSLVRLGRDGELDDYTYRVAGCVGEFWTRLGFRLGEGTFATVKPEVMEALGRSYGQGLQLVNVLRDAHEDWHRGRCYLPGSADESPGEVWSGSSRWRELAASRLHDGLAYCQHLQGRRLAFASGLPALLGLLTLRKLEKASWEDLRNKVKIPRRMVRKAMVAALVASLAEAPDRWEAAWRRLSEVAEA